ncbi:unnamed protein product [Microthlaspi erraticum]|uniref:SHSP domain-containing protein n=1 Tax=Microthlaspi erraticum TaxID=1685480 RepID=A0A6D2HBU7_9BRAS|nr:unnamed protein product [Microthlaspi erraticum]
MVLVKWVEWKKGTEVKEFKKVFRIPEMVKLDKIKARFNEEDGTLTVTLPKKVKGILGLKIEEVDEITEEKTEPEAEKTEEITEPEEEIKEETKPEINEEEPKREEEAEEPEREEEEEKIEEEIMEEEIEEKIEEERFKKESIEIEINKEGDRITIRGRKPVEEMVMIRWMAWKKEVELRAFRKVFLIPDIVDLDKIKARFDDDDATLTITMPKRVRGISGFKIEEEEEEEEESVDFGDVSKVENSDIQNGEEVEEREKCDERSEIEREEEFGELMEDKERESQVLGEEEKGFSGGLDEEDTQIEDDNLQKIQQTDEHNKILEFVEEEKTGQKFGNGQQELADSNTGSEDRSLRKLPDTEEQENNQEVVEQQESQVETKTDDFGSRAFEESEAQEPDEQLDRTRKIREMEKKTTDDDSGLRNVQGIEEPERGNEENKIQEMVKGETDDHEKDKYENMKREGKTGAKEDANEKMGEGFIQNIERTETKAEEFESDEGDKIHELVEKKEEEEENAKVGSKSECLKKIQENEEQHSKGKKRQEKTLEAEKNIGNDILKPAQEIEVPEVATFGYEGEKGKENKKIIKRDLNNGDAKEEVDAKLGENFSSNISETETRAEEFESDKLKADEIDKIQDKKEEEEENAKAGRQSEDVSLTKLQEDTEKQQFQRQVLHEKQEEIKEQSPDAETNDTPKLFQERCEGRHKIEEIFQEANKNQPEEYTEKTMETGKKINDGGARKVQDIIRQQELDNPAARCEEESKTPELGKSKTNDVERREKEISETETEEQESYRPKILREREKIQETAEEEKNFSKNGKVKEVKEIAEKKTESGDDDISKKVRESDAKEEVDSEMGERFTTHIAETETKAEDIESDQLDDDVDKIHETVEKKEEEKDNAKVIRQREDSSLVKKIQETEDQPFHGHKRHNKLGNIKEVVEDQTAEADRNEANETPKPVQDIEEQNVDTSETCEEKEISDTETKEQDSYRPKIQDKIQELAEEKKKVARNFKEEEEIAGRKTEFGEDDVERKVGDIDQRDSDAMKGQGETLSDGGKGIIAVAETIDDNEDRSKKVQEIEEEQSNEEEIYRKQFQKASDHGEVKDVENEKKKIEEAEKSIMDSARKAQKIERRDSDVSVKYGKGDKNQELHEHRETFRNEQEKEKKDKTDDDVVRKVQGTKEQGLHEPKRDHVSKIKEVVEEKITESEIEAECGGLRKLHVSEKQELHEPKTKPSGQEKEEEEKEKIVASKKITEHDNSTDVQEMKEERPDKPESHEQRYKIQEVEEAGHIDHQEEQHEENVNVKAKLETEDSSKKVQDIQKQEHDLLKRSTVQDKMQETEENAKDGSLKCFGDDEDIELSEPYKRQEEDKIQEPVEMGTVDYREVVKKQDGDDGILRSQEEVEKPDLEEFERLGEKRNIPQMVEEEQKVENSAEPGGEVEGDHSGKFHEFEEGKSYDDWTPEKRKDLVTEEATDPKDRHTGGEEEQEERVKENEKQESMEHDKMQETEENDKTRAMEENETVERRTKANDGSLRKVREGDDPEMGRDKRHGEEDISDDRETVKRKHEDDILRRQESGKLDLGEVEKHCKERKIHQSVEDDRGEGKMEKGSEPGGEMEGHSSGKLHEFRKQKSYEDIKDLFKEEVTDPRDKRTGGNREHEEERHEKVAETKKKVEDVINNKLGKNKELREAASDGEKEEENLVDEYTTEIQETEKENSHESERHEKLDIVQAFVEDETEDQQDKMAEEAAAVVANNERTRNLHSIKEQELKESEEHKEQKDIPETSVSEVKEEENEKETKDQEGNVQELEGKTEDCKDGDDEGRRVEKGKQGKYVETVSSEIEREIQKTTMQESDEKKNQIEELERKETTQTSNHEETMVAEDDDTLSKGREFLEKESPNTSKRRPVEQEKFQELKELEKGEDEERAEVETKINDGNSRNFEMLELQGLDDESEETKIGKPVKEEEETNSPGKEKEENEKIAELVMQDKIDSRTKNQETEEQEPYELLKDGEHDKFPKKGSAVREIEEVKRTGEDVSSRKSQQIENELEKPQKPSEIPEKHNIQETVEEKMNEGGDYSAVLREKSMASSQSQDVEEKGSDQPKKYAEQEKLEELLLTGDQGKEEYDTREKGEKMEKAKRLPQVESKANDETLKKNETQGHESTGLRGEKAKETSDQSKEEEVVGKAERLDEYDSSRKIQEREERNSVNLKRHEMIEKLAEEETSDDKEAKEGNRAEVREIENQDLAIEVRQREQDKKQSLEEKDTSGKENENQDKRKQEEHGKENAEEKLPGNLKEIEELVEKKIKNQEEEDKKSMITEVLAKSEEHESKGPEGQDESREQRLRDKLKDEESEKIETKVRDNESRKIHQNKEEETREQERRKEQGTIKELAEDRTRCYRETEFEDGSSNNIPETDKEESTKPGRDDKREKIQEPDDKETSEDDEEELEIEYEESEEEWEAEVIQEMDSDEDNDEIRQIRRIKLGFRLVGGSTLFMSLIVIVISFIRSKRKIRCYRY